MKTQAPIGTHVDRLLPGCMALFMSALVTCTATWANLPATASFAAAFLHAWMVSLPVAIAAAYLTRPLALRLAKVLSICIAGPTGRRVR